MLKDEREKQGMTQDEVARKADISRVAYTNIENGKRKPSVKVAKRIGEALHIDWTMMYDETLRKDA